MIYHTNIRILSKSLLVIIPLLPKHILMIINTKYNPQVVHTLHFTQSSIFANSLNTLKQKTPRNSQGFFLLWYRAESNRRHKDFQSFALPTELRYQHVKQLNPKSFLFNGLQK
jgi:hypothetical protein